MIKATKNGDFSTKNVVDEYSRLIDNYSGRFVDEYSGSNLQIYNMYDKLWGPSQREVTLFHFLTPSIIRHWTLLVIIVKCVHLGTADNLRRLSWASPELWVLGGGALRSANCQVATLQVQHWLCVMASHGKDCSKRRPQVKIWSQETHFDM